jgi:hypothetical protein
MVCEEGGEGKDVKQQVLSKTAKLLLHLNYCYSICEEGGEGKDVNKQAYIS